MISKCRPIEIIRKKFSDFEAYEKSENEVFLVGYEIDKEGNKKNVKINTKDINFGENTPPKTERKSFYHDVLLPNHHSNENDYISSKEGYHHKVTFNVDLGKYFEFDAVDSNIFVVTEDCTDADLIIDFSGTETVMGETTKILMRNVCPNFHESVNIIVNNYCVAEVSEGETLIVDIFHTHNTEIVTARCENTL